MPPGPRLYHQQHTRTLPRLVAGENPLLGQNPLDGLVLGGPPDLLPTLDCTTISLPATQIQLAQVVPRCTTEVWNLAYVYSKQGTKRN